MDFRAGGSALPMCNQCNIIENLMRCARCKTAFYCSTNHQRLDWPSHKQDCKRIAKQIREQQERLSQIYAENNSSTSLAVIEGADVEQILNQESEIVGQAQRSLSISDDENRNDDNGALPHHLATRRSPPGTTLSRIRVGHNISPESQNRSEQRYGELCRTIISDMNIYGLSVVEDFLGREHGLQILNEVHKMYAANVFRDGQLVAESSGSGRPPEKIRGDKITWVKGTEPGCGAIGYLINQIDAVICLATKMSDNGKLGDYKIKERTKAMIACYPGSGSRYVMHIDNPNRDGRVITAIYYLNVNWDTKRSGGLLRIFPEHGAVADIEPKFDRIIFFWSDKRNPHEVQPAHRTRYAITVWYFDANERETALNRCKQFSNNVNS